MKNYGLEPPTHGKLSNPTKNGNKVKKLRKGHAETLAGMGMREPKNPT